MPKRDRQPDRDRERQRQTEKEMGTQVVRLISTLGL